ncbi:MAG: MBOAT family protein [Oscillospiraceae bacterium]|nr:MBOAT family protein [Oscillospiraceae bacterium]
MVFASTVFLFLFLPLSLALYYNPLCRTRGYRNAVLLAVSLAFYAWGEPVFISLMLLSILWNYVCGLRIAAHEDKRPRKAWLTAAIVFDLLLMFIFKYLSFTFENVGLLLGSGMLPSLRINLPVGISFFTFQIMSYVFDVYYRKTEAQRNIARLALYISMFPQLIAGPIVRYGTVAHEIEAREETISDFSRGMTRMVCGLGKKVLLANYVAQIADNVFSLVGTELAVSTAWLGAVAYSFQVYFDFSGYSDMAIGMGLMFGFHFEENFNYSFTCDSITDFWRRQHISLSRWFRDYVYIPLGGSRVSKPRWVWNIFVVWLLTGIWHGANWTYWIWGLYYFVLLVFEKFTRFPTQLTGRSRPLRHVYALVLTAVGMVIFRAESVPHTFRYIANMFGVGASGLTDGMFSAYLRSGAWVLLACALFSTPVLPRLAAVFESGRLKNSPTAVALYDVLRSLALLSLFALCIAVCAKSAYNPFIYYHF